MILIQGQRQLLQTTAEGSASFYHTSSSMLDRAPTMLKGNRAINKQTMAAILKTNLSFALFELFYIQAMLEKWQGYDKSKRRLFGSPLLNNVISLYYNFAILTELYKVLFKKIGQGLSDVAEKEWMKQKGLTSGLIMRSGRESISPVPRVKWSDKMHLNVNTNHS